MWLCPSCVPFSSTCASTNRVLSKVVVLSGSMEPGLQRGDILSFGLQLTSSSHSGCSNRASALKPRACVLDKLCLYAPYANSSRSLASPGFSHSLGSRRRLNVVRFFLDHRRITHLQPKTICSQVQARRCCCLSDRGSGAAGSGSAVSEFH